MAIRRCAALDSKYIFEYDVGMWTFGTMQVLRERDTGAMKTCKIVRKARLQFTSETMSRLRALMDLQHPHICSVTDVIEDREHFYIVTDFYSGGDVQDWMDRMDEGNWLQENTCAAYIRQALLAMSHSHAVQVYHRDLRPSSFLLTSKLPDAFVKVTDFGLADALDPQSRILQSQEGGRGPYTPPETLHLRSGPADIWSIGAIAHALLTGSPPDDFALGGSGGWISRRRSADDEAWSERSEFARDFVKRCLKQRGERPSAPRLLWHSWLKGLTPLSGPQFRADNDTARELRHKMLCYTLGVMLMPVVVPYNDFVRLRDTFDTVDSDHDGLIAREKAQRILLQRCNQIEAVAPALAIVDVVKTDTLDLCAVACADLIVRDFFAAGPTHSPLCGPFRATDLAGRMVKRLFENFGDRRNSRASTSVDPQMLRSKLRTATGRDIEATTAVRYEELLACLPEDQAIDAQLLTSQITANGGRGTPLGSDVVCSTAASESTWTLASAAPFGLDMSSFFQSCGMGAKRDDSPHSIRIA